MDERVVVTGADGFLGHHIVNFLLARGRNVWRVGDEVDLRYPNQAFNALRGATVVYHMAAINGSIMRLHGSANAELETLQSNVVIDTNCIRAAIANDSKFIFPSSPSVYPISSQNKFGVLLPEDADKLPLEPEGGYGLGKVVTERQLAMSGLDYRIARIFNVYGPLMPLKDPKMVPALAMKIIRWPKEPFVIWGDGTATRCYLYIDDFLDAIVRLERAENCPTINIGNPAITSVNDIAREFIRISGKPIKEADIIHDLTKPTGPLSRVPDITRAKQYLGWAPKTPISVGLERTYRWVESELA